MTCWRKPRAEKVAVLIDGAAYFRALLESIRHARSCIVLLGWDFDADVRLDPEDPETELRRLLPALVEQHPELHIHLLIWDVSIVFGPSRATAPLLDRDWHAHPRIHFHYDGRHPSGAAHHEKIVCIDDTLAFAGGIDLTLQRWDTSDHDPGHSVRVDSSGERHPPVHDLQMAVTGEAAAALAELARIRWTDAGGKPIPACSGAAPIWPASADLWLADVPVGIARTRPRRSDRDDVTEIAQLNDAALAAARHAVYIEAQYLTAQPVADALVDLLERRDGPEVVILVWRETSGWIERYAMGSNRERVLRRLAAAGGERLRVYWLAAQRMPECEIKLHAKLMIVDDVFVRIGSSNLNNRSLGFDTECDLAVEAIDETGTAAIAALRARLLAEHLGCSYEAVHEATARKGLIGAIDQLHHEDSRLRPHSIDAQAGGQEPLPGTALLDPSEPLDLDYLGGLLRERFRF